MLSKEDNETLCRVGRGTPMGDFMRRFWVPATLSSEIAAGGSPQRVRLLGQTWSRSGPSVRGMQGSPGLLTPYRLPPR